VSKLRILITNNTLANRAGSELYVRDLATALLDCGHTPIAYSTHLGEVAQELRRATVPVIDDLQALATPPDVIHGQHHLDTMTALLHFPGVPAISFCHGWLPWEEAPPQFPRILRYLAVDHTCRDRLVFEHAIPEDRIRVLLNFVDLERFKPRGPLPARPKRALVFSNQASEDSYLEAVREACARQGIALDVMGIGAGNACARPEEVIGQYDLIFAKARAAIEALAVGAAVILCDGVGAGPMVTASELDHLRPLNFGIRTLRKPISPDVLAQEIDRYDPRDAAEVSRRIRETAGRAAVVDELITIYQEVIAEQKSLGVCSLQAEERAAAVYFRWLAPRLKGPYSCAQRASQAVERVESERSLRADLDAAQAALHAIHHSRVFRLMRRLGRWRVVETYFSQAAVDQ